MLKYKPEFEETKKRWNYFWNRQLYKRPIVMSGCYKEGKENYPEDVFTLRYYRACNGLWKQQIEIFNQFAENFEFLGDGVPSFNPDFGPDQFAAFYGARLRFSENSKHTNWVKPIIDDWNKFL
ncbi:MAG TPA: hypothetical protein PLS78_05485, partial [bacterium]|nr:hypothetical protein [bacterium]